MSADRSLALRAADKVFFSIALYMGDGGYQVVRMLIISYRHFMAVRRARKANGKYEDTSENSDALGLGIKLQASAPAASRVQHTCMCSSLGRLNIRVSS